MKKEVKTNFVVKLELVDSSEPRKMKTANLVLEAVNYTDAEKNGYEFYEQEFKPYYDVVKVSKITQVKFNHILDGLTDAMKEDEDKVAESKLFLVKTGLKYQGDSKPFAVTSLIRDFDFEKACVKVKRFVVDEYKIQEEDCRLLKVEETEFYNKSQIMDLATFIV